MKVLPAYSTPSNPSSNLSSRRGRRLQLFVCTSLSQRPPLETETCTMYILSSLTSLASCTPSSKGSERRVSGRRTTSVSHRRQCALSGRCLLRFRRVKSTNDKSSWLLQNSAHRPRQARSTRYYSTSKTSLPLSSREVRCDGACTTSCRRPSCFELDIFLVLARSRRRRIGLLRLLAVVSTGPPLSASDLALTSRVASAQSLIIIALD